MRLAALIVIVLAPAAAIAETWVFRETQVGIVSRNVRQTWTVTKTGDDVKIEIERREGRTYQRRLSRLSHQHEQWRTPFATTEYSGKAIGGGAWQLARVAGEGPASLSLRCAPRDVDVHPAFAELVEGWKNDDESMEPPSWAPAWTRKVRALVCKPVNPGLLLPFSDALTLVAGGKVGKEQYIGVEWAFTNNDMVIQTGGLRFIPPFAR